MTVALLLGGILVEVFLGAGFLVLIVGEMPLSRVGRRG